MSLSNFIKNIFNKIRIKRKYGTSKKSCILKVDGFGECENDILIKDVPKDFLWNLNDNIDCVTLSSIKAFFNMKRSGWHDRKFSSPDEEEFKLFVLCHKLEFLMFNYLEDNLVKTERNDCIKECMENSTGLFINDLFNKTSKSELQELGKNSKISLQLLQFLEFQKNSSRKMLDEMRDYLYD